MFDFIIVTSFMILVGKQIVLYNVKIYKMERRWRQFSLSSYKRIFLPCCDTTFATIMIYVASKLHNEVIKIYNVSKDMIRTIYVLPYQKYLIVNILSE